ncbi:hypothetical protein CEXT_604041 [Caerostris extrusa]|uniref:Uncharacterized protein n=1 Tax=Caerostris extrusa TaxID=172846 RepID=A0AAV4SZ24_CAEEX|nr:hypothetical protein CEXT_604041 [Caerostris extrusa]
MLVETNPVAIISESLCPWIRTCAGTDRLADYLAIERVFTVGREGQTAERINDRGNNQNSIPAGGANCSLSFLISLNPFLHRKDFFFCTKSRDF